MSTLPPTLLLPALLGALILVAGCSKDAGDAPTPGAAPMAAIGISPATSAAGQSLQFSDASGNSPTAWAWTFGDGSTSALENPRHIYAATGTFTVTLTASNAGGGSRASKSLQITAPAQAFSLAQTISDGAQRTTLAFDGLALITGNLYAQSFFPPGKVADYTGFQYLRDNDPDNMGHNTSFLTRVADNVIFILGDSQFLQLKNLAVAQQDPIRQYGLQRWALMKAFRRLLDHDLPVGSTGLDLTAVKAASRALYLIDGQISFDRALLYAGILNGLSATQTSYLDAMKGRGWSSWPDIQNSQINSKMQGLPAGTAVAVMTYASDLYSWYAGSIAADVYFCPERQGTYYGGFYIKDAPAVGHEGYSISEQLTATAGAALCDSAQGYVNQAQAALMSSLVDIQRNNLYAGDVNIVDTRMQIAALLRSLLVSTAQSDAVKAQVLALSGTYGDLDGEDNYQYATVFAQVGQSLTADQKTRLAALRTSIMSGTYADGTPFDYTTCTTPFLYSDVITDQSVLSPYIANTDGLFNTGAAPASAPRGITRQAPGVPGGSWAASAPGTGRGPATCCRRAPTSR